METKTGPDLGTLRGVGVHRDGKVREKLVRNWVEEERTGTRVGEGS